MSRSEELLRGAARELALMPEVRAALLAQHVAGPDGRCVRCASAARLAPRWPCRLAVVAGATKRAGEPGHPGSGTSRPR